MRRALVVVALLACALVPASPAYADAPERRFAISIRAEIMDREGWFDSDVECVTALRVVDHHQELRHQSAAPCQEGPRAPCSDGDQAVLDGAPVHLRCYRP